jgi:hypothetical protein
LPDEAPVESEPDRDATAEPRSKAQADLGERREQARLERSLSALDFNYDHLRSMAVEALVSMKDPRATSALVGLAASGDAASKERRRGAQVLWHHAADLAFADSTANQAIKRLPAILTAIFRRMRSPSGLWRIWNVTKAAITVRRHFDLCCFTRRKQWSIWFIFGLLGSICGVSFRQFSKLCL